MKPTIKVLIKLPGKDISETNIRNSLESFQREVGGYIEAVPISAKVVMIVNEEGKLFQLEPNFKYYDDLIRGVAVFVGVNGEDFDDVPITKAELIEIMKAWSA